ncbi:MAG: hypothetical protein WAL85_09030, partial [Candidatus Korobacteraceae bacterium]
MKRGFWVVLAVIAVLAMTIGGFAQSNDMQVKGKIVLPPSSRGLIPGKVSTPLTVIIPDEGSGAPPAGAENPGSIACVYGITTPTSGCPLSGAPVASGGSKAIAVVDYGNNSTLQADFNAFNSQYGLPAQTLQFICPPSCTPCPSSNGTGW